MASYEVIPKPSVEKDLRSLSKPTVLRIMKALSRLGTEPFQKQTVKLEGAESLFRIRVGEYRVIYEVDRRAKQVIIHYVRHRREVYRNL